MSNTRLAENAAEVPTVSTALAIPLKRPGRVNKTLLHNLAGLMSTNSDSCILAFTSTRKGEGVSYVIESLAVDLRSYTGCSVLVGSCSELPKVAEKLGLLDDRGPDFPSNENSFSMGRRTDTVPATRETYEQRAWKALRARYQYIFIDCPSLDTNTTVLSLPSEVDATILIVRAGFGRKQEIQQASRVLAFNSRRFLGCILNRRTYPVPRWLYRWL